MSGYEPGPERCSCGKKAEAGMPGAECYACAHGMLPEPVILRIPPERPIGAILLVEDDC